MSHGNIWHNSRGLFWPKSFLGVPAEPRKFDFLYANFLPKYPPISLPFLIENHPILPKCCAVYNNLLKIHPLFEFGLLRLWWKPTGCCTKFCKKAPQKAGTYTYFTTSMWEPPLPEHNLYDQVLVVGLDTVTIYYIPLLTLNGLRHKRFVFSSPISQYERPRPVALASSACVDKTTKIITEFTHKDPFLHLKRAN